MFERFGSGGSLPCGPCEAHVGVLPWHSSLNEARDAYINHAKAWIQLLQATASDVTELEDKGRSSDVIATFKIAHRRFNDVLPPKWRAL
jgi:hypothetical protein